MTRTDKTLAQQLFALVRLPVTVRATIKRSRLRWRGDLQPSPLSESYEVDLAYAIGDGAPDVRVLRPNLHFGDVGSLPHVYSGDRLCLCYPRQWDGSQLIARTVVPWASEWLLHFELWKATGKWHGGGHEPAVDPRPT